jgi:hypothetical protein
MVVVSTQPNHNGTRRAFVVSSKKQIILRRLLRAEHPAARTVHPRIGQKGIFLPLQRHPFSSYDYALKPGWKLDQYGIEQQAEIVRHVFLLRNGEAVPGAPPLEQYAGILPF